MNGDVRDLKKKLFFFNWLQVCFSAYQESILVDSTFFPGLVCGSAVFVGLF